MAGASHSETFLSGGSTHAICAISAATLALARPRSLRNELNLYSIVSYFGRPEIVANYCLGMHRRGDLSRHHEIEKEIDMAVSNICLGSLSIQ